MKLSGGGSKMLKKWRKKKNGYIDNSGKHMYTKNGWEINNYNFLKPVDLKPLDINYKIWKTEQVLCYHTKNEQTITVPAGFLTDGASIPHIFWSIIGSPFGRYCNAAIIHDYLYFLVDRTRQEADNIFYEAMTLLKVPFWRRKLMWLAVRIGAGWIWTERKKRKNIMEVKK